MRVRVRFARARARGVLVACFFSYSGENFSDFYCFIKKNSYVCAVNQLNLCSMSKKLGRVYYAVINRSMGDTLDALVTVSTDLKLMVGASGFLHANHPLRFDFAVVRSTEMGYFGGKVVTVAVNGEFVN